MLLVGPKRRYWKQQPEPGLHCGCPGLCFCTPKDEWNLYRIYKHPQNISPWMAASARINCVTVAWQVR